MPDYTEKYKLKKPLPSEFADIADLNGNADLLEEVLDKKADLVDGRLPPEQVSMLPVPVVTTAGTGAAYTATVPGVTELKKGMLLVIVPHVISTSTAPSLNVNGLGARTIYREDATSTIANVVALSKSWLDKDAPVLLKYMGAVWHVVGMPKVHLNDVNGTLPVGKGGTGKSSWTSGLLVFANSLNSLEQLVRPSSEAFLAQKASGNPYWIPLTTILARIGGAPANHTHTPGDIGITAKKSHRLVVGTSSAGYTNADCDYLCDGTDDQDEINAALNALPDNGGEVHLLDGTYNITSKVYIRKGYVTLSGSGASTILKRMSASLNSSAEAVLGAWTAAGNITIRDLCVDGNSSALSRYESSAGIRIESSSGNENIKVLNCICTKNGVGIACDGMKHGMVSGNICIDNYYEGIRISYCKYCTFTGNNISHENVTDANTGIFMFHSKNCTLTSNTLNMVRQGIYINDSMQCSVNANIVTDASYAGLLLSGSEDEGEYSIQYGANKNVIIGNIFINGNGTSADYTSGAYTILLSGAASYNTIAYNNILGKNYVAPDGTENTFIGNKY